MSASTRSMSRGRGALDGVEDDRAADRRPRRPGRARRRPARPTCRAARRPRRGTCRRRPSPPSGRRPTCWCATLPIVVVLPTPLTPTNSHTFGLPPERSSKCSARSAPARRAAISPCSASSSCVGLGDLLGLHPRPQVVEQRVGDADADVGAQQRLLELLPRLVGDRRPRPSTPVNAPAKAARALASRWRNETGLTGSGSTTRTASASATVSAAGASGAFGGGATGPRCGRRWRLHARRPAAVDDQHADSEHEHGDGKDEKDPLHRRPTLSGAVPIRVRPD